MEKKILTISEEDDGKFLVFLNNKKKVRCNHLLSAVMYCKMYYPQIKIQTGTKS